MPNDEQNELGGTAAGTREASGAVEAAEAPAEGGVTGLAADAAGPKAARAALPASGEEAFEYKGRNLEEAILLAEHRLKMTREEFNYEIVTAKTRLFGIKSKEIVIRVEPKRRDRENAVEDFLRTFVPLTGLDIRYQVRKRNGLAFVVFEGEDKNLLLRNDGALLLAIQHVLNKLSSEKVQVDCEFFRKRKEKNLRDFAQTIARQVSQSGREEILDVMNPYERRIVHIAVNQVPGIASESLGEGFLKKVKVYPVRR